MCLGIPGRIIEWLQRDSIAAAAIVEFAGMQQSIQMACVPDAEVGDFVIVHAGIAIARIDAVEAEKTLADLQSLAEFGDDVI